MSPSPNNAQHPETPHLSTQPEDFYRTRPSLSITDDNHQSHTPPSVSPADSQAPIMASTWTSPGGDFPLRSGPVQDEIRPQVVTYPPPPPPIPLASPYRSSSFGVVNGEVGGAVNGEITGVAVSTPTEQFARYPIAPLSAGLKTSGTTREEIRVAELEEKAQQEDRRDLAVKLKVRLAKVVLRSINCACSMVVLALVSSTFAIFNATRNLAPRNKFRPWSASTPTWPQIAILVISCISLFLSLCIMFSYWKGGHNRAERIALHATIFAGAVFIFTIAMWSAGIGIMQASRSGNDDQDLWGWACKDNIRRKLFQDSINYTLVCRQQDWVVVCAIIEISVEFIAICIYLFAFYRLFYTKRRLRKSMNVRDEARSSLWLAKLKEQKELEETDPETSKNTTYNQLNFNSAHLNSNSATYEAEEGRVVPILQPAPVRHHLTKHSDASDAPLRPTTMRPSPLQRFNADVPPTPRSVTFSQQPATPGLRS
ncbi:hypothetical protein K440DRAFT_298863 [Wilcoxina mikolae CBS 423.85]|nr:hypothetical protein K440DRAFT_298863 [Wilcoxina mikolae CBS 423.85]